MIEDPRNFDWKMCLFTAILCISVNTQSPSNLLQANAMAFEIIQLTYLLTYPYSRSHRPL